MKEKRAGWFGVSLFQRETPLNKRKIYVEFGLFFAICFVAELFPIYSIANKVEPSVLGMPFGWLVFLTVLQFIGLAVLYRWEYRGRGEWLWKPG